MSSLSVESSQKPIIRHLPWRKCGEQSFLHRANGHMPKKELTRIKAYVLDHMGGEILADLKVMEERVEYGTSASAKPEFVDQFNLLDIVFEDPRDMLKFLEMKKLTSTVRYAEVPMRITLLAPAPHKRAVTAPGLN